MSAKRIATKQGSLTTDFKAAAITDGDGALAFMLLAAFGVSLATLMTVAEKIVAGKEVSIAILALTAGVQIRNHVVFVGADHGGLKARFPELIIEGSREQGDQFNFGAVHALGHVLAHMSNHEVARKVLGKAGSCVTGEQLTDSDAGKINKEILEGWSTEDRATFQNWLAGIRPEGGAFVQNVANSLTGRAKSFSEKVNRRLPPKPPVSSKTTE